MAQFFGGELKVEIAFGADLSDPDSWVWVDVTEDVRQDPGISTSLGRNDESSTSNPANCSLTLNNTSGDYSLGGQSQYWPYVRRNTPVRVSVDPGDGERTMFLGFADGFTPGWDSLTGKIPIVNLSASGTLRRLSQGSSPVQSPFRRALETDPTVVAYWPFEEGEGSTLAKNLRGGTDFSFTGTPDWTANDDFLGSAELPVMKDSYFNASVFTYENTGENQVTFLLSVPDDGLPDGTVLAHIHTTGSLSRFDITYEANGGWLGMFVYNRDGSLNYSASDLAFAVDGQPSRIAVDIEQNGTAVNWAIAAIGAVPGSVPGGLGDTISSRTCGVVSHIEIAPHSNVGDAAIGHVAVANVHTELDDLLVPLVAYTGEFITSGTPGTARLERVALENSIRMTRYTAANQFLTEYDRIGPQRIAPLLELLQDCETADRGQLWDGKDPGLSYTTRRYREEGVTALSLDATALVSFSPVDDDQRTRNKAEVKRYQGVSATYEDVDGPMGTAAIGTYDTSYEANLYHDVMVIQHAGFEVNLGTVEGYRYPSVTVDLRANPELAADVLDLIPGDRVDIENADSVFSGFHTGTVSLIVEGFSHDLSSDGWSVTLMCSLFYPWGITRAAANSGDTSEFTFRVDTASSQVWFDHGPSTLLYVETLTGPVWTTDPDDFPLTLEIGGVPVVATGSSVWNSTVIRFNVNLPGGALMGTPVKLYQPRPLGL